MKLRKLVTKVDRNAVKAEIYRGVQPLRGAELGTKMKSKGYLKQKDPNARKFTERRSSSS